MIHRICNQSLYVLQVEAWSKGAHKTVLDSSDSTQSIMDSLSLWTLFTNIDGKVQKVTSLMLVLVT